MDHLHLQVSGLEMMITKDEIEWFTNNFPDLKIDEEKETIEGTVWINSVYDKTVNMFTAFMDPNAVYPGQILNEKYQIKISKNSKERRVTKLWVYVDSSKWIPKRHFFDTGDGRACLTGPVEEDDLFTRGYSFFEYFERFVIPFLYAQSYFDKHGRWPWPAYDHNAAGILQSFKNGDSTKPQVLACLKQLKTSKQWNAVEPILRGRFDGKKCLCGSGYMMNKCHTSLILVARDFQKAINQYGLS